MPTDATSLPSGEKVTRWVGLLIVQFADASPDSRFHNLNPSRLRAPVGRNRPSGENATVCTKRPWALMTIIPALGSRRHAAHRQCSLLVGTSAVNDNG